MKLEVNGFDRRYGDTQTRIDHTEPSTITAILQTQKRKDYGAIVTVYFDRYTLIPYICTSLLAREYKQKVNMRKEE